MRNPQEQETETEHRLRILDCAFYRDNDPLCRSKCKYPYYGCFVLRSVESRRLLEDAIPYVQ